MSDPREQVVLIVDDNPDNLDVLTNLMLSAGYEVAVAMDGQDALAQAAQDQPDLILLDVQMPGTSGFEVAKRLRDDPATAELPIIFTTALSDVESKLIGFDLGALDYITKPFESKEVLARVRTHMRLRALVRTLAESNERLAWENQERLAAEAALARLYGELERRVEERTAELTRALAALEQAQAALAADAATRDEELRAARAHIEREVLERQAERVAQKEEIIAVQRAALAELSTPMIPITDRIMVMPMIGVMSEERAEQLLETALRGVHAHSARVVILDVTGMKLMDGSVASSLSRTASALRLLGAQAVITGVPPRLAQALIGLGVDVGAAVVRSTLQDGIAYALERTSTSAALLRAVSAPRR